MCVVFIDICTAFVCWSCLTQDQAFCKRFVCYSLHVWGLTINQNISVIKEKLMLIVLLKFACYCFLVKCLFMSCLNTYMQIHSFKRKTYICMFKHILSSKCHTLVTIPHQFFFFIQGHAYVAFVNQTVQKSCINYDTVSVLFSKGCAKIMILHEFSHPGMIHKPWCHISSVIQGLCVNYNGTSILPFLGYA